MSRTRPFPSALPTDSAVGFVANIFRGTACMQEAFRQEGGEFQYLEKCWSDSAVLHFILLGWIGLALKILLFVLLATFLGACIQGRRPWYVFMSFVNGTGKIVGGLCSCLELDDEVRESETVAEAEKGLGTIWQEEREGGGYFGSPKQKVLSLKLKRNLTEMLTMMPGVILEDEQRMETRGRRTMLARREAFGTIEEIEKQGTMSWMVHNGRDALL